MAPPLSPSDAATLLALLDTPGSVAHAATSRGITAEKFLALIANPAARQAIEDVRAFAAARREIRADSDREEFTAVLREVAKASPDLVEKRRAATAGLRALDRATGYAAYPSSSPYRSSRRVAGAAGAMPTDPYYRPWREIRIPRPTRSGWESDPPGATACPAATTATRSSAPTAGKPCDESSTHDLAGRTPNGHAPAQRSGTRNDAAPGTQHDAPDPGVRTQDSVPSSLIAHRSSLPPTPSAIPSPSHTPLIAADIQLAALRTTDIPETDSGIATVHGFFPPEIGDYALFAERFRDGLKSLLGPQDTYTLAVLREDPDRALVRASLVAADQARPGGAPAVLFHLARTATPAGPCWLNTGLQFCDSG